MKLYLELYENIPVMLYTYKKNNLIEIDAADNNVSELWVVEYFLDSNKSYYRLFEDYVDAFDFAMINHIEYIHHCSVDVYKDPDTQNVTNAFPMPLKYIGNLELEYRCHNKNMSKVECIKEAVKMWEIFSHTDYQMLHQIIQKYPIYREQYQHHLDQYEFIVKHKDDYQSRDEFMNAMYPIPVMEE